jgi:hypothetical protein
MAAYNFLLSSRTGIMMMMTTEAVRISETSVYCNETTRRYIPKGCNLLKTNE